MEKKQQQKNKKVEWFHLFTAWSGDGFGLSHTVKCDKLPNNRNWLSGYSKGQKTGDWDRQETDGAQMKDSQTSLITHSIRITQIY